MVGENIQKIREQIQTIRGGFAIGQFKLGERIATRPLLKQLTARGFRSTSTTSSEGSTPGVYEEPASAPYEKFISV
jgi:hypothetical protein